MAEAGFETTPLLLVSLSPPSSGSGAGSSALSRNYGRPSTTTTSSRRRGGGGGPYRDGSRLHTTRSQAVHPLHADPPPPLPSASSARRFGSTTTAASSRRIISTPSSFPSSSSAPSHQTIRVPIANKVWQAVVSLPHRLLCFSSPVCSPCCGLCCCFSCIRTSEYGVMQRFGKFETIMQPGLHVLKWPMEREAGRISMRIKQLDIDIETKSRDHVFIRVHASIQYQTNSTHLYESFYSLQSPARQLTTLTHDILRSTLPQLDLDDIFSSQESIALELHRSLNGHMNQYGYIIHHALICQIRPNDHVKRSMNEMEASKRMRQAMPQKAEAVMIEKVKEAEARAERAHLNGIGVARQRGAIASGMREVVESVVSGKGGEGNNGDDNNDVVSAKAAMDLLLLTQYFDVVAELAVPGRRGGFVGKEEDAPTADGGEDDDDRGGPSTSLFLMHMPETVSQLSATARECFAPPNSSSSPTVKDENLLEL